MRFFVKFATKVNHQIQKKKKYYYFQTLIYCQNILKDIQIQKRNNNNRFFI